MYAGCSTLIKCLHAMWRMSLIKETHKEWMHASVVIDYSLAQEYAFDSRPYLLHKKQLL